MQNPSRAEWNVEMFRAIERALIQVPQTDTGSLGQASQRKRRVNFSLFFVSLPLPFLCTEQMYVSACRVSGLDAGPGSCKQTREHYH